MRNAQDNAAHTCSYSCDRPECIKAQRDELAAAAAQEAVAWQRRYIGTTRGNRPVEWHTITKDEFEATKAGKWADRYEVRAIYAAPVTAAPGIDPAALARDIHHAIADAGLAPMSPSDNYTLREVIRSIIDAAMQAQAGDAEVQP